MSREKSDKGFKDYVISAIVGADATKLHEIEKALGTYILLNKDDRAEVRHAIAEEMVSAIERKKLEKMNGGENKNGK